MNHEELLRDRKRLRAERDDARAELAKRNARDHEVEALLSGVRKALRECVVALDGHIGAWECSAFRRAQGALLDLGPESARAWERSTYAEVMREEYGEAVE